MPAGIISTLMAAIPILAFPLALLMGIEGFSIPRLLSLSAGIAGVALIALSKTSLPDHAMSIFLLLALIAPFFYAPEGNIVSKWGTGGQSAVQLMCGASIIGTFIALPAAVAMDQFIPLSLPFIVPDYAMVSASVMHVSLFVIYIWLVGKAGSNFAAQVSYHVTGFWGVLGCDAIGRTLFDMGLGRDVLYVSGTGTCAAENTQSYLRKWQAG